MTRPGKVVVFARAPELGRVKSRLAAAIGEGAALHLYRAFLADTIEAARTSGAFVILAHTPSQPFWEQSLADATLEQRGETFGERFDAALSDGARLKPRGLPVALVGADSPQLGPEPMRQALRVLKDADAVVGPNVRHGFHLIGFARAPVPVAGAFDRLDEVAALHEILANAGRTLRLLAPSFDVDVGADLDLLRDHFLRASARPGSWVAPRTYGALTELAAPSARAAFASGHMTNAKKRG